MNYELLTKRAYLPAEDADGWRVLIDRLWPRGLSKAAACIDAWNKAVAPTPELRRWFGHQDERFESFAEQYRVELDNNPAARELAVEVARRLACGNVTLVYGARNTRSNHALVLRGWLLAHM